MDTLQAQITGELQQIAAAIEQLTNLRSNWNGELVLVPLEARYRGLKPFSCAVHLRADLAADDLRWRTLIHESFHAVSAGYNHSDFDLYVGWEEGVVEQLQRLFRARILNIAGFYVEETRFAAEDASHLFNVYIASLERIRGAFDDEAEKFYLELLAVPIKERSRHLYTRAMSQQNKIALYALSAGRRLLESTQYEHFANP